MGAPYQLGPIKYGRDYNFYKELTISSGTFGGDNTIDGYIAGDGYGANLAIPFSTQGVIMTNESTGSTQDVEFSFNGTTVHGVLKSGATSTSRILSFQNRAICKIWFRVRSGSTSPGSNAITVLAWGIR